MAFECKKKVKRSTRGGRSRFSPSRVNSAVLKEASRDPEGPGVLDLIHLHFQDLGYKASTNRTLGFVEVDFSKKVRGNISMSMSGGDPARVRFCLINGEVSVWFRMFDMSTMYMSSCSDSTSDGRVWKWVMSLGEVADPKLISRLEGVIEVFALGVEQFKSWVKSTLS